MAHPEPPATRRDATPERGGSAGTPASDSWGELFAEAAGSCRVQQQKQLEQQEQLEQQPVRQQHQASAAAAGTARTGGTETAEVFGAWLRVPFRQVPFRQIRWAKILNAELNAMKIEADDRLLRMVGDGPSATGPGPLSFSPWWSSLA